MSRRRGPWRRALVTGASSGIGRELAVQLAELGADLVVVARRTERLEALRDELTAAHAITVEVLSADLADPAQRRAVEARVATDDAPIDLLVNNAGFGTNGRFHQLDAEREHAELEVLVTAVHRLTRAALPGMVARGRGAIVNVASVAGFQPLPFHATYSASKAFVIHLGEALHEECRGTGVTVTTLCPGFTRTEFMDSAGMDPAVDPGPLWLDAADVARAGLEAAARGDALCVPGLLYRAFVGGSRLAPRRLVRRVGGAVTRRL